MPNWNTLLGELQTMGSSHDILRRRYLVKLHEHTGRNVIVYYSGWLQKPELRGVGINDDDKNGFMTTINGLDRSLGLDLLLHTPGGETAATESLVDYLRSMFQREYSRHRTTTCDVRRNDDRMRVPIDSDGQAIELRPC